MEKNIANLNYGLEFKSKIYGISYFEKIIKI